MLRRRGRYQRLPSDEAAPPSAVYQEPTPAVSVTDPLFAAICQMCMTDKYGVDIDTSPTDFAPHRKHTWPFPATCFSAAQGLSRYVEIYDAVPATGLPNCLGAHIPISTKLNIDAWRRYVDLSTDEVNLIDYIQFGFPLGYLGPVSSTEDLSKHPSAERFPANIDDFLSSETPAGAVLGLFSAPTFTPWPHISPMMSCSKAGSDKRRMITDLTFPPDRSINAYGMKNIALGEATAHTLPSVADLVSALHGAGPATFLSQLTLPESTRIFLVIPWTGPSCVSAWARITTWMSRCPSEPVLHPVSCRGLLSWSHKYSDRKTSKL